MLDTLVCPKCKMNLTKDNRSLSCRKCNLTYTIDGGVYNFLSDADSFCSELSIEETRMLLNDAQKNGWKAAVREMSFKYPYMNEIFLNNDKADWLFHCLDLSKTSSCLELGSGWGTTAFCLARYYNEVWSLDPVKLRLNFQKIRQDQDRINNIKFVRASSLQLPFQENHFDLVAAKNFIKDFNLDIYFKKYRNVHLYFFREIRRILKDGGCLYIGVPNKINFSSILRGKNHGLSSMPYSLTEKVTDLYCNNNLEQNIKMKDDLKIKQFQVINYSFFGYKKILDEAGFSNIEFFWTIDFDRPEISGRFDIESFNFIVNYIKNKNIISKSFKSLAQFMGANLSNNIIKKTFPFISPSFLIFAYKDHKDTTFESKLLQSVAPISSFIRISGSPGVDSKIIYRISKNGRSHSVIKFPRFKGYVSLISEEEKMSRFNKLDIKRKDVDSVIVFVEPFIKGKSMRYYNISHNQAILNWLIDFQKQTQQGYWDFNQFKVKVENLNQFLSVIPIDNEIRLRTSKKLKSFLESLSKINLAQNSEHGDFSVVNIIIGDGDNKVYVTDWEYYNERGDPLFDFVFFILASSSDIKPFPQAFVDAFNDRGNYAEILKNLILEFCKVKKLPTELILQAVPYVLLRCIYRTTFETDYRHFQPTSYITLLELWDKISSNPESNSILRL